MKKWLEKHIGMSWRTTLIGYAVAAATAIYPLVDQDVNWQSRASVKRYVIKLLIAAGAALWGKYSADSHQVKTIDNKVNNMS